jgi:HD-like signal output (HDOD) protein
MLRLLLILFIVAAVIMVIRTLMRSSARREEPRPDPLIKVSPPLLLPSPQADITTPAVDPAQVPTSKQVFEKLHELALGAGKPLQLQPSARLDSVAQATRAALENVATEPRYAPRRPMLLPQLTRAVNDSEMSRREISTIISRDPALAGNLLKLANSPFYRINSQPVESVDRAVAVLGTDGIRSLIATALIQPVFRLSGGPFPHFAEIAWEHTFRSATAAESHAAVVENADPFAAQLLGLIMGLASLIVFRVAMDQFEAQGVSPDAALIATLLDQHTAEVARKIASSWDLSGRILTALEDQIPGLEMHEPTALGRSLTFGRLLGALAVLNAKGAIDDPTAKAAVLMTGASAHQFDRFWSRLTGQPPLEEEKRHRPAASR